MEWTRDKTLALISEYRKRRGLWDMTHDDYRKKEMKQKLLIEVANSLGGSIPVVEIEKKFHTLRTQYHREINRMKRKEPYNSKWFGFKNLQFLSSPKACRLGKGRIKSEITEDGTVTKYIIRESPVAVSTNQESNGLGGSVCSSSNNVNEEFVSINQRKPTTTITYETPSASAVAAASRSRELEKLIEETTKDVDEVEETKPKTSRTLKEIHTIPLEHHTYSATVSSSGEMTVSENYALQQQQQNHHETQQRQQQLEDQTQVETIDIQRGEEITYQTTSSPSSITHHTSLHHQAVPARIIKIQRRDTCPEDELYDDVEHQQDHHQQENAYLGPKHRIYYEANGQQHTAAILAPPTCTVPINSGSTLLKNNSHPTTKLIRNPSGGSQYLFQEMSPQNKHQQSRDDFSTYGEYVANEMRCISNREILISLKHKINTALFEASMAELQK